MKRVTGFGGVFIKCRDKDKTQEWYQRHLGIDMASWGAVLNWQDEPHEKPYSVFSLFKRSSEYFAPSEAQFMINFRVENLDALVAKLREEGVEFAGDPMEEESGKFAWVMDPEGNKIELWEQPT